VSNLTKRRAAGRGAGLPIKCVVTCPLRDRAWGSAMVAILPMVTAGSFAAGVGRHSSGFSTPSLESPRRPCPVTVSELSAAGLGRCGSVASELVEQVGKRTFGHHRPAGFADLASSLRGLIIVRLRRNVNGVMLKPFVIARWVDRKPGP